MGDVKKALGGDAAKDAKKAAKRQQADLAKQRQQENLRAAESESEINRRNAVASSGGIRSSLLATSPAGLSTKLGG